MTPLRFEEMYQAEWAELEALLEEVSGGAGRSRVATGPVRGDRVAALYRRACEHLALARSRAYPAHLQHRLERLTAEAHQTIYHESTLGLARLRHAVWNGFPQTVRRHAVYVWVAAATLLLPTFVVGALVYARPELILSVVSPDMAEAFEEMYDASAESIGRQRTADTDWIMFGYYIRNNVGVAFQCFAGGLFAGVGSLFFLAYNGAFGGAIGGYLTERGLSSTFYSFIVTHSAFELTAIILSGAAGLRLGHALLAPGRRTRIQALVDAGRGCTVILYGTTALLVIAAAVEAFWSSAGWIPPAVKYTVGGLCWLAVLGYLLFQGRHAG